MKNAKLNYKKAGFHILVWAAAFLIGTMLIPGYSVRINWTNTLVAWGFYAFIFYINYLFLIPKFFNRKWMAVYIFAALAVLFLSFVSIRYVAVESARKDTEKLSERLQEYEDVKDSFEEKERIREMQRNIEWRRRREEDRRENNANNGQEDKKEREADILPAPRDGGRGRQAPPSPGGMPGEGPRPPADSARLAEFERIRREQDSLLKVEVVMTSREDELGQLRREYDATRTYSWMLSHSDYNPLSQHNLPFIFALIVFYMASIVVFFAEQSGKAEKRRREMERERAKAELAYLKQQINPHFLFNTLNSIYSYTIGVSEEASDAVLKLSSILRYMLYETNRDRVPLPDELAVLDDYIELQRLRITDKTEIQVVVNGDTRPYRIEPMLLIPIVENAFKYGVDSVESSFVKIEIDVKGGGFTFRVTNRVVRRNEGDRSNSGIGIKNIQRRLELIYGPGNYGMEVAEQDGIFSVTLRLNLKD